MTPPEPGTDDRPRFADALRRGWLRLRDRADARSWATAEGRLKRSTLPATYANRSEGTNSLLTAASAGQPLSWPIQPGPRPSRLSFDAGTLVVALGPPMRAFPVRVRSATRVRGPAADAAHWLPLVFAPSVCDALAIPLPKPDAAHLEVEVFERFLTCALGSTEDPLAGFALPVWPGQSLRARHGATSSYRHTADHEVLATMGVTMRQRPKFSTPPICR